MARDQEGQAASLPSTLRPRAGVLGVLLGAALVALGCASAGPAAETVPELEGGSGSSESAAQSTDPADTGSADPAGASAPSAARFDTEEVPTRGPADAEVLVEVYSDFECPHCAHARGYTERVLADFPSVRVAYRHFPLDGHRYAALAAEASVEAYAQAGNPGFWCYHDQVFENQASLSPELLVRLASRCDLSPSAMEAALRDHRHRARVAADRARGEALGLLGTPSFAVNGTLVSTSDYTDLEEAVDRAHSSW